MSHYGTATRQIEDNYKVPSKDYVTLRKHLKKQAACKYPGQQFFWAGGTLYFGKATDLWPRAVPEVQNIPKPGRNAVGWSYAHYESHQPTYLTQEPSSYTSSGYRSSSLGSSDRRWIW